MTAVRPKGKVKVTGVEWVRQDEPNLHVKVLCEDAEGQKWFFHAEAFNFDLLPVVEGNK